MEARILALTLFAEDGDPAALDAWLRDHVADVLQVPGVRGASILHPEPESPGVWRRTVYYRLCSPEVLGAIRVAGPDWPESGGLDAPGTTGVELLLSSDDFAAGAPSTENCRNCGEVLLGQHCAHCGPRADVAVLSLYALTRDLAGDLFSWDARIWRTLRPLAFRPGFLTLEYLQGRRARYTPPLRLYLVLSLLFFLVISLGAAPDSFVSLDADIEDGSAAAEFETGVEICEPDALRIEGSLGAWEERLRDMCRSIMTDTGEFVEAMRANVPGMMFATLPLLAALMLLLQMNSGRFYVEHLLFFVHVHAFFFLGALLVVLVEWLGDTLGDAGIGRWVGSIGSGLVTAQSIYLPYYLYRSMRRVYGQGRWSTLIKCGLLAVGYLLCLLLTSVGLFVTTAVTM